MRDQARLLAAVLGLAACSDPVPPSGPLSGQDCLVVVLDALHAARLGCYGHDRQTSPALDAFAETGTRFARARSNASWTLPSTTTLFTGLHQGTHGLEFDKDILALRLDESADTLAELFGAAGYETTFACQNPFAGRSYGLDQGFDHYKDYLWRGDAMIHDLLSQLQAPSDSPRFTYVHLRRPHTPFDAPEEDRRVFVDPDYAGPASGSDDDIARHNSSARPLDAADLAHHADLYDANIRAADRWLGRLLEGVDRTRTLVVVLSDHGEAVGQHGRLGHNWHSWEEYVHVPLLVSHPDWPAGRVLEQPVTTVDVMPTLVELFGLPEPVQDMHGRSFAALLAGADDTWTAAPVFTASRPLNGRRELAVVDEGWKYIRTEPGAMEQLYDLSTDPGERRDRVAEEAEQVARLAALLRDWSARQTRRWAVPSPGLDDATLEQLRQLGYVR